MLDAKIFVDLSHGDLVADRERERLGSRQDLIVGYDDLDIAGWRVGILVFLASFGDVSSELDDTLIAQVSAGWELFRVNEDLNETGSVTDVGEPESTQITNSVDPAIENDFAIFVRKSNVTTVMSSLFDGHFEPKRIPENGFQLVAVSFHRQKSGKRNE